MTNLEIIAQAIAERKGLNMSYQKPSSDRPMDRTVLPYRIVQGNGHTYVWAYCSLRSAARTFRIDRIHKVDVRATEVDIKIYRQLAKGTKLDNPPIVGGRLIAAI